MKKWLILTIALVLGLTMLCPALAETADAPAAEAAVEEAVEEATEATEAATEEVAEAAEEAAEEPQPGWAEQAFGKFAEIHWYTYVIFAVMLILGIFIVASHRGRQTTASAALAIACFGVALILGLVVLFKSGIYDYEIGTVWYVVVLVLLLAMIAFICLKGREKWTARTIAYAGICMSIAFVLSLIKLYRAPQGGSVTPASLLPLILFALAFGPSQGLVVGIAYGLLQLIEDPYVIHPIQLLVDYPMAFGAIILCCVISVQPRNNPRWKLPLAVLLAYVGRYAMAVISGAVFFGSYGPGQSALAYSLAYNIAYIGPEAVLACLIVLIPGFERLLGMMRSKG